MNPIIYPEQNSGRANFGQTGENPPHKGGWCKIGWHQEGRDEPAFLKPLSRVTLILGPTPLNKVRPLPFEWQPIDHVGTGYQVWLSARGSDGRSCLLQRVLKLASAGERRTKTLRGPEQDRYQGQTLWNQRDQARHSYSIWWCLSHERAQMALGYSSLDGSTGGDWVDPA